MAGFDEADPLATLDFGYRSDALRNGSIKSYNGYFFPPALRSKITVVPEPSDDGINTKYLTIAISIEFFLTDGDIGGTHNITDESSISSAFATETLKKLTQPGQALHFTHDVLGDFKVNAPGGILQDVDYGPKPQVLEIEPLGGGNAARCEWLCVTRVSPCLTANVSNPFVQFSYSTSWGWDPSGYMIRTIEGAFELPSNRSAALGSDHAATSIENPIARIQSTKAYLVSQFPLLTGFRRQVFFRLKPNRKTIEFKFEDTEIRSDNKFPPGVSDIELTQSITSSLQDGAFLAWKLTYSGRLETVNAKNVSDNFQSKKLAFYWLGIIIRQKRIQFQNVITQSAASRGIGSQQPLPDGSAPVFPEVGAVTEGSGNNAKVKGYSYERATEGDEPIIYPTYLSISDSLYSNAINFTVSYYAVIGTSLLAKAIGLFEPLNIPGTDNKSWVKYLNDSQAYTESVNVMPSHYPVVDLCHPLSESPAKVTESSTSSKSTIGEKFLEVTYNEGGSNWIDYKNDFLFLNDSMSIIGTKLSTNDLLTTDIDVNLNTKDAIEMEHAKPTFVSGDAEFAVDPGTVTIFSPSKTVAYVQMKGYAIRMGKPVNAPYLIGVGDGVVIDSTTGKPKLAAGAKGSLAHKYGQDKVVKTSTKTGMTKDGKPVYTFKTTWVKTYVLDSIPNNDRITTSGVPGRHK